MPIKSLFGTGIYAILLYKIPFRHDWKIVDWDVKPQHNQLLYKERVARF